MAETRLEKQSILDGLHLPRTDSVADVTAVPPTTRYVLRARPEHAAGLAAAIGAPALPDTINRATEEDGRAALMLGPDEWLLLFAETCATRVDVIRLSATAELPPHALVDISARHVGLDLRGPRVETILATGCPLPLDPVRWPVGRATRTLFARSEIVVWRRSPERFHIETGRSFAPYLCAHLAEAIRGEAALMRLAGEARLGLSVPLRQA